MKKILFIASIALSVSVSAQKASNKLSFPKGQKLEVTTETKKTSNTELMGQSMEGSVNSTMTEVFDVQNATANGATIERKIKHLVFTANGMGQTQSFDSEKEEDRKGELGKVMEKSLNNNYKMTVDAFGKITDIQSSDSSANGTQSADQEAMAGLLSMQLGMNFNLPKTGDASIFKILPDREISQGDTWTDTSSADGQKRTTVYKVNSITDNAIVLDYTENININSTQQIMGTDASIKSDDAVVGQITLDKKTGLLKQRTATMDTKATMDVQGMSIPSTGKTTITVTVKTL